MLNAEGFPVDAGNGLWLECPLPGTGDEQTAFIEKAATSGIAGLYVRCIESRANMEMCSALMAVGEAEANRDEGTLGLIASLETPLSILNAADIAKGHPRLRALVFDGKRLGAALHLNPAAHPVMQAQNTLLLAASAASVPALLDSDQQTTENMDSFFQEIASRGFDGAVI
nr:aldolase/citrate lyase family protein [Rhizobium sp. L1K21]